MNTEARSISNEPPDDEPQLVKAAQAGDGRAFAEALEAVLTHDRELARNVKKRELVKVLVDEPHEH